MRTRCIITGVTLVFPEGSECCVGDLFQQGDIYIMNANTDRSGDGRRLPVEQSIYGRTVRLVNHDCYFERRGVFVFSRFSCELNREAEEHIKGIKS